MRAAVGPDIGAARRVCELEPEVCARLEVALPQHDAVVVDNDRIRQTAPLDQPLRAQVLDVAVEDEVRITSVRLEPRILLFQAIRELLINVVRHAKATEVEVRMRLHRLPAQRGHEAACCTSSAGGCNRRGSDRRACSLQVSSTQRARRRPH